jgi:hypothetical protein
LFKEKKSGIDLDKAVRNGACESFMKTLKDEEVHRNEYLDLNEAMPLAVGLPVLLELPKAGKPLLWSEERSTRLATFRQLAGIRQF